MQALRDEIDLRDETRELENGRPAYKQNDFIKATFPLAQKQRQIAKNIREAITEITALPDGSQKFGKELKLLQLVSQVMDESGLILSQPETGDPAIAAETEAIELLLQASRQPPGGGGGGGGGNPGGGGSAGAAQSAALAKLGPGGDAESTIEARPTPQATGNSGRELPEEFRSGLDAYFHRLEQGHRNP